MPPHNNRDLGPTGRREVLDAYSRHVMGGGGFADHSLRLGNAPPLHSEQQHRGRRGKCRLMSIEQLPVGMQHVQAQIRTARLRDVPGEVAGWEDGDHDEEGACEETACLGRGYREGDEVPLPSRGYEVGAKGWELVNGVAQSVIGWKVEVVYWNRAGKPRWHTGVSGQEAIVIDHQRPQGEKELVQVFFPTDRHDHMFAVDEPTLAWKKPGTKEPFVSPFVVRSARAILGEDD